VLVTLDAGQRAFELAAQRGLAVTRNVDEFGGVFDEQRDAVGEKVALDQWPFGSELPSYIVEALAHRRQGNAVLAADGRQDMQFAKVGEREQTPLCVGGANDRGKPGALTVSQAARLAEAPVTHG
jgi:hypothetical protein